MHGKHVDGRSRIDVQVDVAGPEVQCAVGGQRERGAAEFDGADAEKQVVHDRVARDRDVDDVPWLDACLARDVGNEFVDAPAYHGGEFAGGFRDA